MDFLRGTGILLQKRAKEDDMGFVIRWMCAFALLAATFNPTEYNYVTWLRDYGSANLSIAVLAGLILGIGYIIYLRATLRSIGAFGMLLVLAVVGAGLWVLYDFGVLQLDNPSFNLWIGLVAVSYTHLTLPTILLV